MERDEEVGVEAENIVVKGSSFQYPPFQKALPYFPDYGYQVTLHFKDELASLDKITQEAIKQLISKLSGQYCIICW